MNNGKILFLSFLLGFGSAFGMNTPTKEMQDKELKQTTLTQLDDANHTKLFGAKYRKPRMKRKGRFPSSANLQVNQNKKN